jgi:hypothetical protein
LARRLQKAVVKPPGQGTLILSAVRICIPQLDGADHGDPNGHRRE